MKIDYLDKFKGTLLSVALGDTLGRPFEGKLMDEIHQKFDNIEDYIKLNKKLFKGYTDDTQLTLHLLKSLLQGKGFNIEYLISEFAKWIDDPPINPGYGSLTAIKKLKYNIPWQKAATTSGGNGTAMRVSPLGLLYSMDLNTLIDTARKSSIITHSNPAATSAAIIIARAVAFLVNKTTKIKFSINEFIDKLILSISHIEPTIREEFVENLEKLKHITNIPIKSGLIKFSQIGVKPPYFLEQYLGKAFIHPYAMSTTICSLFIFLKNLQSYKGCIFSLVTAGGDTDTAGAIGGSLAGAYYGFSHIPNELTGLVNNKKTILSLSEELYNLFRKKYL
ncbi:MAG: hypothetical protein GF317_22855 [Candidatus Lokiarchaeota archaeon]|nr:hypothetical protein [Candidatus Lokiarchaeota archaeon]MBD3202287.1 hypothetical protein [Candidatus Lokiarchaeota archaeon]